MRIYLVGGAVRDQLLGRAVHEKDYVVVGATPAALMEQGYQPVGKSFPVFLHPETKEEYALARTEKKISQGYHGFTFNTAPSVTLQQDLARRDLTINAIAQDEQGNLIDPFHGQTDLEQKILRHVSPAFAEDPVRVLRLARFAARFAPYGFQVAPETQKLVKKMVDQGEIDALVPERVLKELLSALKEPEPAIFFTTLAPSGALARLFPAIARHWQENAVRILNHSTQQSADPFVRFAALGHFLGNTTESALSAASALCRTYKPPKLAQSLLYFVAENAHSDLAQECLSGGGNDMDKLSDVKSKKVAAYPSSCGLTMGSKKIAHDLLILLEKNDAFRRKPRFLQALQALRADAQHYYFADCCQKALDITETVTTADLDLSTLKGEAIKQALHEKRLAALQK